MSGSDLLLLGRPSVVDNYIECKGYRQVSLRKWFDLSASSRYLYKSVWSIGKQLRYPRHFNGKRGVEGRVMSRSASKAHELHMVAGVIQWGIMSTGMTARRAA